MRSLHHGNKYSSATRTCSYALHLEAPVEGVGAQLQIFTVSEMMTRSLRQLHLLLRHGDRVPTFSASTGTTAEDLERAAWTSILSEPSYFSRCDPLESQTHHDVLPKPWGQLTSRGAKQAFARGARQFQRYSGFIQSVKRHRAVASNFARTQLSASRFLCGLFGSCDPARSLFVPPPSACTLAVFERDNELYSVQKVIYAGDAYRQEEARLKRVSDELSRILPYFRDSRRRFMWIKACDVLQCYKSNSFALPASSLALEEACMDHLLWRFRTFFSYARPLQISAGGLLQTYADEIAALLPGGATTLDTQPHDLTVHCGHDVTLLPILFSLAYAHDSPARYRCGPTRLTLTDGTVTTALTSTEVIHAIRWPGYASLLALEVHESSDSPGTAGWVVRWRFEDEPLVISDTDKGCACVTNASSEQARPPVTSWHEHWNAAGSLDSDSTASVPPTSHQASEPDAPKVRAELIEGEMPLDGFLQLAKDVNAGLVGRPLDQ